LFKDGLNEEPSIHNRNELYREIKPKGLKKKRRETHKKK